MSTKISLCYDENTHIYQECADEDHVFIKVNDRSEVKVALGIDHVIALGRCASYEKLAAMAAITDEKIEGHARATVAARLKASGFEAMFGMLIYGSNEDPPEQQVERAVSYYKKRRDELLAILKAVEQRRVQNFTFGLEELL